MTDEPMVERLTEQFHDAYERLAPEERTEQGVDESVSQFIGRLHEQIRTLTAQVEKLQCERLEAECSTWRQRAEEAEEVAGDYQRRAAEYPEVVERWVVRTKIAEKAIDQVLDFTRDSRCTACTQTYEVLFPVVSTEGGAGDELHDLKLKRLHDAMAMEQAAIRHTALATENRAMRAVVERGPEWHAERFPTATVEHVALKLAEEAGEVCAAVIALAGNEHPERAASVVDECADVFIVLSVLVGRYFPFTPLMEAVQMKLATLASLPPVADERGGLMR